MTSEPRNDREAAARMHSRFLVDQECPPCSGDCNQGRTCPVRQACALPDAEPLPIGFRVASFVLRYAIACCLVAAVIATLAVTFGKPHA